MRRASGAQAGSPTRLQFLLIVLSIAAGLAKCAGLPQSQHAPTEIEAEQLSSDLRYVDALAMFNRVLSAEPHNSRALAHRAALYNSIGRNDLALADADAAIALNGATPFVFTVRALAEQNRPVDGKSAALQDASRAIVLLQRSVAPENATDAAFAVLDATDRDYALLNAFTLRAEIRKERKQYELALADADAVIGLDPQMDSTWIVRASIQRARARFEEALHDDLAGASLPNHSSQVLTSLCSDYAALGQLELATRACNEALAIFPQSIQSHTDLGLIHLKAREPALAEAEFAKALDSNPGYSVAQYGRGLAEIALGEAAAGRSNLASAASRLPDVADWFRSRRLQLDRPART